MTAELSEALARNEPYDGLSAPERAAAETSLHLSTCRELECLTCDLELAAIRRVIRAAAPVIAAEVLADQEASEMSRWSAAAGEELSRVD